MGTSLRLSCFSSRFGCFKWHSIWTAKTEAGPILLDQGRSSWLTRCLGYGIWEIPSGFMWRLWWWDSGVPDPYPIGGLDQEKAPALHRQGTSWRFLFVRTWIGGHLLLALPDHPFGFFAQVLWNSIDKSNHHYSGTTAAQGPKHKDFVQWQAELKKKQPHSFPWTKILSKLFHSFPSAWHSYVNPETGSLAQAIVLRGWFSWNVISTHNVYNSLFDSPGSLYTCGFQCSEL